MTKVTTKVDSANIRIESEHKIQQDCFVWFWGEFPHLRKTLFHIPNGGKRSRIAGNRLKSIGLVAGIPDFCLIHAGRTYFFEMKKPKTGRASSEQKQIRFIFAKQGFDVPIIESLDQFKTTINGIVTT